MPNPIDTERLVYDLLKELTDLTKTIRETNERIDKLSERMDKLSEKIDLVVTTMMNHMQHETRFYQKIIKLLIILNAVAVIGKEAVSVLLR